MGSGGRREAHLFIGVRLGSTMCIMLAQLSLSHVCELLTHARSTASMCSEPMKLRSRLRASLFALGCLRARTSVAA